MVRYELPGMKLIPQEQTSSCWYASASMIISWVMSRCLQSFHDLVPPELDARCRAVSSTNADGSDSSIGSMVKRLGLKQESPVLLDANAAANIQRLLRLHGPLWVNVDQHVVVIAGVDEGRVKVYDPYPKSTGLVEWRSLSGWLFRTTANREASLSFLYLPPHACAL